MIGFEIIVSSFLALLFGASIEIALRLTGTQPVISFCDKAYHYKSWLWACF